MKNAKLILRGCAVLSVAGFVVAVILALHFRAQNETLLADAVASAQTIAEETRDHIGGTLVRVGRQMDGTAARILHDGTPGENRILAISRNLGSRSMAE